MAKTITKEIIVSLATIATSFFSFWLWRETMPLLQSGVLSSAGSFVAPVITLIFAAGCFFVGALLIRHHGIRYGSAALAPMLPFFLSPLSPPHIFAFMSVSGLLAMFASRRMHREYEISLGFSTAKIAKAGLPLFFTAASILAAWFYFQTLQDQQKAASALIPRPITDLMIRVLAEPLKQATGLAEIRADMTVDELLAASIRKELGESGVTLSEDGERGITQLLAHQRDAFARQYGISLQGNERIGDALHRAVIERLEAVLGPFVAYLPLVSTLAFFFAFKAFTFPLYLLSVAMSALLIRLLKTATLVRSERRAIEVERLTL